MKNLLMAFGLVCVAVSAISTVRAQEEGKQENPKAVVWPCVLNLSPAYGEWTLSGVEGTFQGRQEIALGEGEFQIKGEQGWSLTLANVEGNLVPIQRVPGAAGRDLSGLFCYQQELTLPAPALRRMLLMLPESLGSYTIKDILSPGTGARAVFIPQGETTVQGEGWSIQLLRKDEVVTATYLKSAGSPAGVASAAAVPAGKLSEKEAPAPAIAAEGKTELPKEAVTGAVTERTVDDKAGAATPSVTVADQAAKTEAVKAEEVKAEEVKTAPVEEGVKAEAALPAKGPEEATPLLVVRDNLIIFPENFVEAARTLPEKAELEVTVERPRDVFSRDEELVVAVTLHQPADFSGTLTIKAMRNKEELLLVESPWSMKAGLSRRNFSVSVGVMAPGAYVLLAACGPQTAETSLTVVERRMTSERSATVVADSSGGDSSVLLASGATTWLVRSGREKGSMESLLQEAARAGVSGWITTESAGVFESALLPAGRRAELLGREAVLLGQRYRVNRSLSTVIIDGLSAGVGGEALQAALRPSAAHSEFKTSVLIPADSTLRNIPGLVHLLSLPEGETLPFAAIAPFQSTDRLVVTAGQVLASGTSQHSWLALAGGMDGIYLPSAPAKGYADAFVRLGGVLPLLTPVLFESGSVKKSVSSLPQGSRPVLPGAASLTAGPDHLYGFPALLEKLPFLWVFAEGKDGECRLVPPVGACAVAYELISGKKVELPEDITARAQGIPLSLKSGEACLYAFPRSEPEKITVALEFVSAATGLPLLQYRAMMLDSGGRRSEATLPAQVKLTGPSGEIRFVRSTLFLRGELQGNLPLALNETAGAWKLEVEFSAAALRGEAVLEMASSGSGAGLFVRERDALEIEGSPNVRRILTSGAPVSVVIHSLSELSDAEAVQAAFARSGQQAAIVLAQEIMAQRFELVDGGTRARFAHFGPRGRAEGALVLIDRAGTNPLSQMLLSSDLAGSNPKSLLPLHRTGFTPFAADSAFPGPGMGLIQHVTCAFSTTGDAVLLSGSDREGLTKAVTFVTRNLIGR